MKFYLLDQGHTLASALRGALEESCDSEQEIVSCTLRHPLDTHLEVIAPSENHVRSALLLLKEKIRSSRLSLETPQKKSR